MAYALPFIVGMVVTMVCLPILVRLPSRWSVMDAPGERKVHAIPIPRVGGLAMALGVCIAAIWTVKLDSHDIWFLAGAAILIAFGFVDDRFDLDYRIKLVGQILAISIVVFAGGVRIETITLDDRFWLPSWLPIPLTIFFLTGITNAINLADGLDGLAGGTTFLCLCAVAFLSSASGTGSSTALALAFAGAVLGFLRFNTFPATVFMGDAGSQLLGFSIGVLSIRATQSASSQISATIPVLLLALPILDTLSVMVQRVSEGRSPFSADKNHIHHKLLALGFHHHEAVMVIYTLQAALFVIAYFMRYESDLEILAVVSSIFVGAVGLLQLASRSGWRLRGDAMPARVGASRLSSGAHSHVLPFFSYAAIATGICVYALLIVIDGVTPTVDVRLFVLGLLVVIVGFLLIFRHSQLRVVERAVIYVTATVLVYLDAIVPQPNRIMSIIGWTAISVVAGATALRLRVFNDRNFQVTPLDLIVLFMALVVPNLPGIFDFPHGGALAIAKLVVLYYALEMLVSRSESGALWLRLGAACVLGGLAVRPLIHF
ncbi:MAG TPA: MraY family glycosyltransferase [Steroidobacteraceae bacterium]|jgi:UDP-GlcNAc:undecaprenyl-phosphate GlcNAc-1-phosphate transferase